MWLFLGAFKDLKPRNWCLTEDYLQYTQQDEPKWTPNADYYIHLISRLVDSIFTGSRFSSTFLVSYDLTALTQLVVHHRCYHKTSYVEYLSILAFLNQLTVLYILHSYITVT